MLSDDDRELLAEPDAVLFDEVVSQRLIDFLTPFTIPLFFFRGDLTQPCDMGSGTLLNLDGRGYVLTAGHVVEQWASADACAVTIKRTPHTYQASFSRAARRFIRGSSVDIGVLEIAACDFEDYRAYDRTYIGKASRIEIHTSQDLIAAHDWMAVAGYPIDVLVREKNGAGARLVVHTTTLAGIGPAPASSLPVSVPSLDSFDLWVPRRQLQSFPRYESDIVMPLFGGVSGGGCWKTGVRSIPRTYDAENPNPVLVAIHIGSSAADPALDGARFGREVMVGYHLRLLADAFPDMRDSVFQRWPRVAEDIWQTH